MGIMLSTSTDFYKLDKKEFKNFFTSTMLLPFAVLLLSLIGFLIVRKWLRNTYGFPQSFIFLIPFITFLTFINEQFNTSMRVNNELRKFTYAGIARIILEFGLSVVLVVFVAMRWQGRLAGIITAYVLLGLYAFWYFYKKGYLSGSIKKKYIKEELVYAVPVVAMQVSIFSLNTADKFILANYAGDNSVVGIYGVACTFVSVITIFCSAYLAYLFPVIYQTLSSGAPDYKLIKKNFTTYIKTLTIAAVLITAAIPVMYLFINGKYRQALGYYWLLTIGAYIWAITYYFYSFLMYYKHKRNMLMLAVLTTLTSIPCIYIMVNIIGGVYGAAWGVLISYIISFLLTCYFTRDHIRKIFQ